jgi:hypothetical protein
VPVASAAVPAVVETVPPPVADPVESPPVPPVDEEQSDPEASPRKWGKLILWLSAIVVVVIIVTIIRHNAPGQTPGSLTPTSVTSGSTGHTAVIPVSSTVLAQFTAATKDLDAANVVVNHGLAGGGSQTVTQVNEAVSPYIGALQRFDFTLHLMVWPQSMQVPSENLMLRNQALVSFLQSISSESQSELPSWFSQLHALASRAETADNQIRKDIGLATTTSFP